MNTSLQVGTLSGTTALEGSPSALHDLRELARATPVLAQRQGWDYLKELGTPEPLLQRVKHLATLCRPPGHYDPAARRAYLDRIGD